MTPLKLPPMLTLVCAMCAAALIASLCAKPAIAQPPRANPAVHSPKDVDWGGIRGSAQVALDPPVVSHNGRVRLRCEMRCTSGGKDLFNPFLFEQASHIPVQIVVTSEDGQSRRELLRPAERTSTSCPTTLWQLLSSFKSAGREYDLRIGRAPTPNAAPTGLTFYVDLPPGVYFVQAIYNHWLIAPWPGEDPRITGLVQLGRHTDNPQTFREDMDSALMVSEAVRLVVKPEIEPQIPDGDADPCPLRPELRLDAARVVFGRRTDVEIRFTNQSTKHLQTYDLYLNGLLRKQAVALVLLAPDGTRIGDLLARGPGPRSMIQARDADWICLPPGGTIAQKFGFVAGRVIPDGDYLAADLRPGKYFLELRVHDRVLSSPPKNLPDAPVIENLDRWPEFAAWQGGFPGPEICRSNRVELEILPRTGD
jgi:hypothetical protein